MLLIIMKVLCGCFLRLQLCKDALGKEQRITDTGWPGRGMPHGWLAFVLFFFTYNVVDSLEQSNDFDKRLLLAAEYMPRISLTWTDSKMC